MLSVLGDLRSFGIRSVIPCIATSKLMPVTCAEPGCQLWSDSQSLRTLQHSMGTQSSLANLAFSQNLDQILKVLVLQENGINIEALGLKQVMKQRTATQL